MSCIYVDLELSHNVRISYDLGLHAHIAAFKRLDEAPVSRPERQLAVQEVRSAVNRWLYEQPTS
jgi:hypothetical protein